MSNSSSNKTTGKLTLSIAMTSLIALTLGWRWRPPRAMRRSRPPPANSTAASARRASAAPRSALKSKPSTVIRRGGWYAPAMASVAWRARGLMVTAPARAAR